MATIKRFEDLEVWQMARTLSNNIRGVLDKVEVKKKFRLVMQIESSVGSVMDNIAEGFERGNRLEFIQFLGYAKGSCGELRSQLYRLFDWKLITQEIFNELMLQAAYISGKLERLSGYLRSSHLKGIRKKDCQP
jgi:four helix bundle protein